MSQVVKKMSCCQKMPNVKKSYISGLWRRFTKKID